MRILKWLIGGIAGLVLLAIAGVTVNVLMALDWDRTHSTETAALPFYEPGAADGLYQIRANDMVFRARIYGGANDGPGMILLHGHPEASIMWQPLLRGAAEAGFRVIAFDQRGYSPGARPKGVAAYKAENQIADVIAIADAMGFEQFHLVGHDWGSIMAWATAIFHPDRLLTLTTMSLPHPSTLTATVVDDTPSYIRLFSLPFVPEAMLLFNDLKGYKDFYTEQSEEEIAEYLGLFSEPGAATATLNWYRAIQDSISLISMESTTLNMPILFIYGDKEFWVTPEYLAHQRTLVSGPYAEIELEARHWLMQPHAETIVGMVLDHIDDDQSDDAPATDDDQAPPDL